MFIEPSLAGERRGWIEVICGSMLLVGMDVLIVGLAMILFPFLWKD